MHLPSGFINQQKKYAGSAKAYLKKLFGSSKSNDHQLKITLDNVEKEMKDGDIGKVYGCTVHGECNP